MQTITIKGNYGFKKDFKVFKPLVVPTARLLRLYYTLRYGEAFIVLL